jgi:branched-chain amino acid transport system ATP-binding protein
MECWSKKMILELKEISKSFGEVKVINRVSLALEPKVLCALIGPNGAGKSTLFNVITGLFKGDEGKVIFDGVEITNWEAHAISSAKLSRTFQITSIFPRLSLFDSIQAAVISCNKKTGDLFSGGRRVFRDRVLQILDFVGLADRAEWTSGALPHGDKKRLELAIALANKPKMLLLDEPTSGMAPEETGEIMNLVKRLRDEMGLTIFFVEHDMGVVFGWAERVIVLHQGAIFADALPIEIRNNKQVQEIYLGGDV